MTKQEAKDRLRIPELWRRFGLPGKPAKICSSPFREDTHPSFSVNEDGTLWNDFATGEGGDAVEFLARLQPGGAPLFKVKNFIELAAAIYGDPTGVQWHERASSLPPAAPPKPGNGYIPGPSSDDLGTVLARYRPPTQDECRQIGNARGLDPSAVWLAGRIGTLLVGEVGGFQSWIITDEKRRVAEARRMNGEKFPAIPDKIGERKAHTLRGSKKDWPVGILPRFYGHSLIKRILFVEGGPDYLAALALSLLDGGNALPVAVLGVQSAKKNFHPDAAELLRRRRVRIYRHADDGLEGIKVSAWVTALEEVGCDVDVYCVQRADPRAKDLNDLMKLRADDAGIIKILP